MTSNIQLTLNKFEDLGGKYFEQLVAIALDELGYEEGSTYVGAWAQKCVPGTWIEADFIISRKSDKTNDPLNNGRVVLAIGHATSENSAGMKFHRDVEQLLEVKALPNGDEYRVVDILFCCPRETMGGWSKELVAINEAIYDDHIIIWKHDWGMRLLQQIQLHGEKLTEGDAAQKKKRLLKLLDNQPAFRKQFDAFRNHFQKVIEGKKCNSKIDDIFKGERKVRDARLKIPLLVTGEEKTDFKRGLLQMLALNDWELELLYENHKQNSLKVPIEKVAKEKGMSSKDFGTWWQRLNLLSAKLGECSYDYVEMPQLDEDAIKSRFFKVSDELAYIFDHFSKNGLSKVIKAVDVAAPNLLPYILDLRNLTRAAFVCDLLEGIKAADFLKLCQDCYESNPWKGMPMPRLLPLEVAKTAVKSQIKKYSYDVIANESGDEGLVRNPFTIRFLAGKQGAFATTAVEKGLRGLWKRIDKLPVDFFRNNKDVVLQKFVYERLDGMVKQPKGSVLDALLDAEIRQFAKSLGAKVTTATVQGIPSAFNYFTGNAASGVNVEVPYVLKMSGGGVILVHRISASEGNAGHKWKEFSSKIRSIRYHHTGGGRFSVVKELYATVFVIDGNWTREGNADPLSLIKALHVAGWDFVVFPDQLSTAFNCVKSRMQQEGLLNKIDED